MLENADVAKQPVQAAERDGGAKQESIQGVWQAVEITTTGPGARTITIRARAPT